jgi:hypothetical protein
MSSPHPQAPQASAHFPMNRQGKAQPRVLLLTAHSKIPTLWKVLDNKYPQFTFGVHRDMTGRTGMMLGLPDDKKEPPPPKVLIYLAGSDSPSLYEGPQTQRFLIRIDPNPHPRCPQIRALSTLLRLRPRSHRKAQDRRLRGDV